MEGGGSGAGGCFSALVRVGSRKGARGTFRKGVLGDRTAAHRLADGGSRVKDALKMKGGVPKVLGFPWNERLFEGNFLKRGFDFSYTR